MSTRGSIVYTNNGTHIYEETSEWIEERKGFNIYWAAFWGEYREVCLIFPQSGIMSPMGIKIETNAGKVFNIPIIDIFECEVDAEGFSIGIHPGTETAKELIGNKHKDLESMAEMKYNLFILQ